MIPEGHRNRMGTGLLIILITGAAFGGWAALALLGGERARRLQQAQAQRPITALPAIPPLSNGPSAGASKTPPAPRPPKPAAPQNSR